MNDEWTIQTIHAIECADISANIYRTARRLLDLATPIGGSVKLSYSRMRAIADTRSDGTVRRHLGTLVRHNVLHYSTNEFVYVTFSAAPVITTCAPVITRRAWAITSCAPDQPPIADYAKDVITRRAWAITTRAQRRAMITTRAPMITTRAPVITTCENDPTLGGGGIYTSLSTNETSSKGNSDDDPVVALLTDPEVGVSPAIAAAVSASMSFDQALRVVADWYQSGVSAGALVYRLRNKWDKGAPKDAFRRSPLCARHAPALAINADDRTQRSRYQI